MTFTESVHIFDPSFPCSPSLCSFLFPLSSSLFSFFDLKILEFSCQGIFLASCCFRSYFRASLPRKFLFCFSISFSIQFKDKRVVLKIGWVTGMWHLEEANILEECYKAHHKQSQLFSRDSGAISASQDRYLGTLQAFTRNENLHSELWW